MPLLPSTIVLATHNQGKIQEFEKLFSPYPTKIIPQNCLEIKEATEDYYTFIENALQKARHASRLSGLPTIADDSGICSVALNNFPGIYSARFADAQHKSDQKNNQKLSHLLSSEHDKTVYYYCCLIFITHERDPAPIVAEGKWLGEWSPKPMGNNGFGYDPHFYLPEKNMTVAQLEIEEKNKHSHRAKAFHDLIKKLSSIYEIFPN
ncbi:MAG: RdgB/HAM1 family non-canonical purine NTP pyrophosphatase [Neisseriaceae bacterium]|nr:MAG: RdgB/HAM1 family non-canonical purine NTP pyrophosphatase [Neisseriaceae bacterium]